MENLLWIKDFYEENHIPIPKKLRDRIESLKFRIDIKTDKNGYAWPSLLMLKNGYISIQYDEDLKPIASLSFADSGYIVRIIRKESTYRAFTSLTDAKNFLRKEINSEN